MRHGSHWFTYQELRVWAKKHGWIHNTIGSDDVDYCPECQAKP